eukprot:163675-Rhodomonas_salina.3
MELSKVEVIMSWPCPSYLHELCSFLGLSNYYCCFIPQYAKILVTEPLTDLLGGDAGKKKMSKKELEERKQQGLPW